MGRTVLIADDVPMIRNQIADILTRHHYRIIGEALNGKEAADLYFKLKPDIVTMDIVMPKRSGLEAIRDIITEHPSARIVVISGMYSKKMVLDAFGIGARDYLLKPILEADIVKSINNVMTSDARLTERITRRR